MSAPPIPPTSPYSCSKCGLEMGEALKFCPRCGARLQRGLRFAGCYIAVLCLLALPSALAGGCFLLISGVGTGHPESGALLIGVGGLVFAVLCIWGIVRLLKARRG